MSSTKRNAKKPCFLRLTVTVVEIALDTHVFKVYGWLNMSWEDSAFASYPDIPHGGFGFDESVQAVAYTIPDDGSILPINPDIIFGNQVELAHVSSPRVIYNPVSSVISYNLGFTATLKFDVDVRKFPFDRMVLNLPLNLRTSMYTYLHECPTHWLSDKWDDRNPLKVTLSSRVLSEYKECSTLPAVVAVKFSKPTVKLLLERIPKHWIQIAVVPSFLIVSLSYQAFFVIPREDVSDRAGFMITLILTQVALKFAISDGLPVVPYNTILDMYLVLSVLMLISVAVLSTLSNQTNGPLFDIIAGISTSGAWFIAHIIFFLLASLDKLDIFSSPWKIVLDESQLMLSKSFSIKDVDKQIIYYDRQGIETSKPSIVIPVPKSSVSISGTSTSASILGQEAVIDAKNISPITVNLTAETDLSPPTATHVEAKS